MSRQKPGKVSLLRYLAKNQFHPTIQVPKEQDHPSIVLPEMKLPEPKYFKKIAGRLKSINYFYKKVEGLNEKCKQMVSAGNEILASTNKGLFIISDHQATALGSTGYIIHISAKSKDNKYYVATSEGYFYVSQAKNKKWQIVYPDKSFNHSIYSIVSTDENTIWAGGDDIAYRINLSDGLSAGRSVTYTLKSENPQRYILESC